MRPLARLRALASDRVSSTLFAVFVVGSAFCVWRATYAAPLALHGGQESQYNQLADAFLHFHLWVARVPEEVLGVGNPYNPAQRPAFFASYPDYSLYGHFLYITWGPAPVLIYLVPLHLLGFEPSASVISLPFALGGLGFALATLRAIVRQIGEVALWLCALAGITLACASVLPYVVRFPLVYHQAVASGYCFATAGAWLGVSAVVDRRASLKRLSLMSLCFGLATGSRPTLGLLALLLVPVYMSLRATRPRRGLLTALVLPFGACVLLLAAYDQARFGSPLDYGTKYQLAGINQYTAHFGKLSFLPPGLWAYLIAPPRLTALFPFISINYPQVSYPFGLPAHYNSLSEETGGLLAMAPIAIFVVAVPFIWRRRPTWLGSLSPLLMVMAGAGVACMVFLGYEIYTSSERYETDFMSLILFGALAAWLVLSSRMRGRGARLVKVGGGLLAVWSCIAGLAISYQEIEKHPGTWRTLVNLGSPLSTAIAAVAGHPVLAEIYTSEIARQPPSYSNLGTEVTGFSLTASGHADITIVSPDSRADALLTSAAAGPALGVGVPLEIRISGSGNADHVYRLSAEGMTRIPIHLHSGVNQLVLSAVSGAAAPGAAAPESEGQAMLSLSQFRLADG
ncbi:MAG: hypothetical protein ACYDHN_03735 [Solirubrobacteraceae bacterium]